MNEPNEFVPDTVSKLQPFAELAKQFYLKHWGTLLTVGLLLGLLVHWWGVLAPFVAAFVFAYLLARPSRGLYAVFQGKVPLGICSVLVFLLVLTILASFTLLFIPVLSHQLTLIETNLPALLLKIKTGLLPWLQQFTGENTWVTGSNFPERMAGLVRENRELFADVSGAILRFGSESVLGITGFLVLMMMATIFILPGWYRIEHSIRRLFPARIWRICAPMLEEIDEVITQYIKGMLVVVVFLSTYYAIGLSLAGLQSGWAIGILAGLLSVVPYLGLAVAMVVAVLTSVLELQGLWPVFWVVLVFVSGQMIEGFLLTPLVVGDKIGLSAFAVIFSLAFFGALFGLVGVFLALPLAAIFKVGYGHWFAWYSQTAFYLGQNPEPDGSNQSSK